MCVEVNRNVWVYDIETLKSCFTYTAINIDTEEQVQFVIHKDKNNILDLIQHLNDCKGQIGFNNLNFDYPVIHYILLNWKNWLAKYRNNEYLIIDEIYSKAQSIINHQNDDGYYSAIKEADVIIPQLDLFKIWHYDNKARITGLKALQISMNYPNVLDMPIHHSKDDISLEDIEEILEYNLNDVLATFEFYKKSKHKIDLRKQIKSKYGIDCSNYPDTKIGEELLLKLYCDATGRDPKVVKTLRTYRSKLNFKDCIPSYINFKSKEFNELVKYLEGISVSTLKNSFKYSVIYKGFKYDLGTGGIHGANKSGIYEPNKNQVIRDSDVASLYPSLAIVNNIYQKHLGPEFCKIYKEGIVDERLRAKKAKETGISDALKLSANGAYGKSNSEYSWLYDPLYTIKTTLAGQLSLCILGEMLQDRIPGLTVIQVNTDGITSIYDKQYDGVYDDISKEWEQATRLVLEHVYYSKFVMRDVNNYASKLLDSDKIKYKGAFEIDKVVGSEPAYHKDNSFRIVPLAVSNYFFKDIPIEETIYKHDNIYDFCGRQKFNRFSCGEIHYIDGETKIVEKQQHNVRYYISKSGKTFVKQYTKGTSEIINKGFQVEIFNKYIEKPFKEYNIDYSFYISECYKIIDSVVDKQLTLF